MRTSNGTANVIYSQFSRFTAFVWFATGSKAAATKLNDLVGRTAAECLRVSVGTNKFDALNATLNHVPYGVTAAAADSDHLDLCALVELLNFNHFDTHWEPPCSVTLIILVICDSRKFDQYVFLHAESCLITVDHGGSSPPDLLRRGCFVKRYFKPVLFFIKSSPRTSL